MKIRLFSLVALAGLLAGSCAVEEVPSAEGSIVAVMENDDTRTTVTDQGRFAWSAGDQVWLQTTGGAVIGTLSSGAGTSSAEFTYGAYIGDMTGKAAYPYNSGHSVSGDELSFVLPASYDLGSNLSNTNAAMYGEIVGGTIRFNHLAGVMRFVLKNVPAGANRFQITLDKKINGAFTADLTADYPIIEASATTTASEKTVTLHFGALDETSDISLYIPLPVGTYNTLALGLYDDDEALWTYSNIVTNTISRKTLKLMPSVTLGGSVGGDIEGGDDNEGGNVSKGDYIDEYGINHSQGVEIDGVIWAPVNCGYHATDFKYGKLYQWGRKYGQGYNGFLYDVSGSEVGTYSDATVPTIEKGRVSVITGNHKSKENIFYTGISSYNYDWVDPQDGKLWNSGSESKPVKTEYDPCPDGWRVPTYAELRELCKNYSSWTSEEGQPGYWFSGASSYTENVPQVFFPAAGNRNYGGSAYSRGGRGSYWSSRPDDDYYYRYAYSLYFHSSSVDMDYDGRAGGYSVRCVQE